MLTPLLQLLVGLALLVKGGDLFVTAAIRLAGYLRMPRVVIGSTLVSLATTMPELVVSLTAGARDASNLAVGNAVGSCLCNLGLILGITATLKQVDVHLSSLRIPLAAMIGTGVILVLLTWDLTLSRTEGFLLVLAGLAYFAYDFLYHARDRRARDVAEANQIREEIAGRFAWFHGKTGTCLQFALGAGIVVLGSRFLVDGAVSLASRLGIPPLLIGLTVVAVGTSLPELVTAVTSARRNVSDLAVGNVLGANVANLTLIVGAAAMLSDVTLAAPAQRFNGFALLGVFALFLALLWTGQRLGRREGVVLLVTYNLYIAALVLLGAVLKG